MIGLAVDPGSPSPVSGPEARTAARDLLRRAGFHRDDPSYFQRALNWIERRFAEAFLQGTSGGLLLVAVVIIGAVIALAIWKAGPLRSRRGTTADDDLLRPDDQIDHRAAAAEFAAAERWAEAMREWLRAAVQTIEDRGVLLPRPGRTGTAIAREAGPRLPGAADPLAAAVLAFDEVWFGGRTATAADAEAGPAGRRGRTALAAGGRRRRHRRQLRRSAMTSATASPARAAAPTVDAPAQAGAVVLPWWRRIRFWLIVLALVVIGAVIVSTGRDRSNRNPLDPDSYTHSRQRRRRRTPAHHYGTDVHRTSDIDAAIRAGGTVVVPFPETWSADQLSRLRAAADRLVLVAPLRAQLSAVGAPIETAGYGPGARTAGCGWTGASATGPVDVPYAVTYLADRPYQTCYGGSVVISAGLVVLGAPELLANVHQADTGVAALAVNAISAERTVDRVTWLMPGAEALSGPTRSLWDLFPNGAHRAAWCLIPLALLMMLWRGRRFGAVVTEPLPVVVRAAELVEGHGRLYWRAGARDRAAAALRAGTLHRLAGALGTDGAGAGAGTGPYDTVVAAARRVGRPENEVAALLLGPPPGTDPGLARLSAELDRLEAAVHPNVPSPTREAHR